MKFIHKFAKNRKLYITVGYTYCEDPDEETDFLISKIPKKYNDFWHVRYYIYSQKLICGDTIELLILRLLNWIENENLGCAMSYELCNKKDFNKFLKNEKFFFIDNFDNI